MGKDRRTLPMKELISSSNNNTISTDTDRMPKYITKKPAFSCPISPYILWHHGLQYSECPVGSLERDMTECIKCIHRGDSKVKVNSNKRSKSRRKKSNPKVEKRSKEPIPKIGKTYHSD